MSGETFMGLLTPNLQPLRKFVQGRLRAPAQADDVLQETLLHAFTRRGQLRIPAKFRSWLWAIALNEIRMSLRGAHGAVSLDAFPNFELPDREPSPLARYAQVEKREWLFAGLAKLSERDSEAIRLLDLAGLSIAETAQALSVSESATKTIHFRARRRLARALRRVQGSRGWAACVTSPGVPMAGGS